MEITNTDSGASAAGDNENGILYESPTTTAENEPAVNVDSAHTEEEGSEEQSTEEKNSKEAPKKKVGGFQRKIDRLNAEIAALKAGQANNQGQQQPQNQEAQKPAGETDKAPSEADYDNVLDYLDAKQAYNIAQALKADRKQQSDAAQKHQEDRAYIEQATDYKKRADAILETVPDFYERVQETLYDTGLLKPRSPLELAILESPISEKIALHLTNSAEDRQILSMLPPAQMHRAIGMMEAQLGGMQGAKKAAVRTTKATAPITPVGKQASTASKSPEEMSQSEYEAWLYSGRK